MKQNDDDWDPEVESLLEYAQRKSEERTSRARRKRETTVQDDPFSSCGFSAPNDAAAPRRVPETGLLQHLLRQVHEAEDVEHHIAALRVLAAWLHDEADRLAARNPADFHVSGESH